LINGLFNGIETRTGLDFFDGLDHEWRNIAHSLVYTGKIDDFYHCVYGKMQYRSLRFEHELIDIPNYQGVAIMNFTEKDIPYTRIVEHKHFETFGEAVYANPQTVISREYPTEYANGNEPYYPINDATNEERYEKYKKLASYEENVIFGGRLAEYKYYDMDDVIESALNKWYAVK